MALNNTGILLAYAQTGTSSSCFQYRWELRVANKTAASTAYYIYTYLRWVSGNGGTPSHITKHNVDYCPVTNPHSQESEDCRKYHPNTYAEGAVTLARMRHRWHITYVIDGKTDTKYFRTEDTWLPDDNAKIGVYNTGHLHMFKNEWYQWGPPKTGVWKNDGSRHTVQVTMHMEEFGYPWDCPSKADTAAAKKVITMPQYAVKLNNTPEITLRGPWYSHAIGCSVVTASDNKAVDYKIQVSVNGGKSWIDCTAWTTLPPNKSLAYTPTDYFRYAPGTVLTYRAAARSSTGSIRVSQTYKSIVVGGGVKIKVDGVWKLGTVYIKVNGVWKRAEYVATKQNGAWKISVD